MEKKLLYITYFLGIMGSIWAGSWAVSEKIATADDLKRLENMTIATFKTLQDGMDLKFLQQQLTILIDRKYRIRDEIRKNPNDPSLNQDYQQVCQEIADIEEKIMQINSKKSN